MRSPVRRAVVASAWALIAACKHAPPSESPGGVDSGQAVATSAVAMTDAGLAAPRCKVSDGAGARSTLADVGDRRSLEIGEGIPTADGAVVGIVHAPASGAEALVARLAGGKVAEEWVVAKRGELVADAPPPRPLVVGDALYAAYVARIGTDGESAQRAGRSTPGTGSASRRIVLKKSGVAAPLATYAERADESLAFDAAPSTDAGRVALVWDEDSASAATANKGGITVAVVPLSGGQPLAPRVVSGDTADPDAPRIAPRAAGGWWVAWTAHRAESPADASARAATVEAPAEERAYSWVEVVGVGDDGTPLGPPRRITSAVGHAASFDLAPRSRGAVDVVVRDETQSREGEGGRILRVVVLPDGSAEEPSVIVPAGAGRGSVDLVTSAGGDAWLAFSDTQDRALVLPLGPTRAALGPPSLEDALEGGRLLTLSTGAGPARFVAVFPGVEGALFREIVCAQ